MTLLNSKQLFNERQRLADEQAKLVTDGEVDNARVIEGQIKQIDLTLQHVLDEEEKLRTAPTAPKVADTFGVKILGPKDQFRGLEVGFKNDASVSFMKSPYEVDLTLDAKPDPVYMTFADTLAEVPAQGSVKYQRRKAQIGNPDTWGGVTTGNSATKAKVIYQWEEAVANEETIAGYVPVSKQSLQDYAELLSVIEHDLLLDLKYKTDDKYLNGNNSAAGIVGIKNTAGIQEVSDGFGGAYFDAIRKMRTKVMTASNRIATHVLVSPDIKEAIDLYKTTTGLYQSLGDGFYWGMQVIEDPNFDGILVYDMNAAKRRSVGDVTVEVGYFNDQFIKNELSILAEHRKALQVTYPDAFCYASKTNLDKPKV